MTSVGDPLVVGQLTYTSFDSPGQRGGGWQVKQVLGSMDPELQKNLVAKALGTLNHTSDIPRFPTAEDLATRPRRVAYGPVQVGVPNSPWAFWHTIPAGPDASGRSNVFNQMLVPGPGWSGRPALWCSSPEWLTPFGADAVREADMPLSGIPLPSPDMQAGAINFLFSGSNWRLGTLCVLVDAVLAAMAGGLPVALLLEDMSDAPYWFVLVELVMSRGAATRLAFSTLERAADQTRWAAQGFHLVAVPAGDVDALARTTSCLPLDPSSVELSPVRGQPHRTSFADEVRDTELSALIMDRFTSPSQSEDTVAMIDEMAGRVGDRGLDCRWPLAMGCWLDDPGDLRHECAEVLTLTSPSAVAEHPDMSEALQEALRYLGGGADKEKQAWNRLSQLFGEGRCPGDHVVRAAAGFYGELALSAPHWLAQRSEFCVPTVQLETLVTPEQMGRVSEALRALQSLEDFDGEATAIIQWNAVLLLRMLGWPLNDDGRTLRQDLLDGPLARAVTGAEGHSLAVRRPGDGLAHTDGVDGDDLLKAILQVEVDRSTRSSRPGYWLPTSFADMFHLTSPQRVSLILQAARSGGGAATQFELAACVLRTEATLDPGAAQLLREMVAEGLQRAMGQAPSLQARLKILDDPLFGGLIARGPIRFDDLIVESNMMPRAWLLRPLFFDRADEELRRLMQRLRDNRDPVVMSLVNIRTEARQGKKLSPSMDALHEDLCSVMQGWEQLQPLLSSQEVPDPELLGAVLARAVAYLMLVGSDAENAMVDISVRLLRPDFRIDASGQDRRLHGVAEQTRRRAPTSLWRLLITTHVKSPLPTRGREGSDALGKVCQQASPSNLISNVVFAIHGGDSEEVRVTMWEQLARSAETEENVRASETLKFFRKWWRDMGGAKETGAFAGAVDALSRTWRKRES